MLITACWNHLPSSLHFLSVWSLHLGSFSSSAQNLHLPQRNLRSVIIHALPDQLRTREKVIWSPSVIIQVVRLELDSSTVAEPHRCFQIILGLQNCTFPQQQRKPSRQVAKAAQQRRKLPTVFTRRSALPVCLSLSGGWERFCGPKTSCDRGCHFERRVISE